MSWRGKETKKERDTGEETNKKKNLASHPHKNGLGIDNMAAVNHSSGILVVVRVVMVVVAVAVVVVVLGRRPPSGIQVRPLHSPPPPNTAAQGALHADWPR